MKALRYHARGDFRLDDVAEPVVRDGWVIVDVEWSGVCGSDLHEFEHGPIQVPQNEPHAVTGEQVPVILGHEFAGTVSEVGSGVENLRVGDRVTVEPLTHCQECDQCWAGRYHLCRRRAIVGVHGGSGGFSARALVPAYAAHKLPDSVSTDVGALVEPLAVAWHSARTLGFKAGQTALVMGAGPIGLATLLCLRAFGASKVYVGVRRPGERKSRAQLLGADKVFDSSEVDIVDAVMSATNGLGVDAVFETSGAQDAMDTALKAVCLAGRIATVAVWPEPGRLDFMMLLLKEVRLVGSMCYSHDFQPVIEALADGRIAGAEHLITKRVALEDVMTEGIGALLADRSQHLKVLVHP